MRAWWCVAGYEWNGWIFDLDGIDQGFQFMHKASFSNLCLKVK
jgi:hypothetical protein